MTVSLLDHGRNGERLPFDAIDMHGHLGRIHFGIPDLDPARLVDVMDRVGIGQILVSHMQCMSSKAAWGNTEILRAMEQHPGRIRGYFSVWPSDTTSVEREANLSIERGFTGLKVHDSNGFPYSDPSYEPAYRLVNAHRMPILFHVWGAPKQLTDIRRIAELYPETSILLAHTGSANTSGYLELANAFPNVYLDLALSSSPHGLVSELCEHAGARKIVWGSDCIFFAATQQIGKVLGAAIGDVDKKRILCDNAEQILSRIVR